MNAALRVIRCVVSVGKIAGPLRAAEWPPRLAGPLLVITNLLLIFAIGACTHSTRRMPPPPPATAPPPTEQATALRGPLRVAIKPMGTLANSGLQLPVVSPGGERVAYLRNDSKTPITRPDLLSGRPLQSVSLYLARVGGEGSPRGIIPHGAAWPTWGPYGDRLVAIAYDPQGRASLVLHEIQTHRTRSVALPLTRMNQPTFSPGGKRLAVSGGGKNQQTERESEPDRIFLIDLGTEGMSVESGPPTAGNAVQMMPMWLDRGGLLFVSLEDGQAVLRRWQRATDQTQPIASLNLVPASPTGVLQAFAGIADPLSPNGRWLAYYNAAADRITLISTTNGYQRNLPPRTRAGCWVGPEAFAAATNQTLSLHSARQMIGRTLLEQRSLPRWGSLDLGRMVLCVPGTTAKTFQLLQLRVRVMRDR